MSPWDKAYMARSEPATEPVDRETQDAFSYVVAAIALVVIIVFGG